MEQTECSAALAYKIQKPGNCPVESKQSFKNVETMQVFEVISDKIKEHGVS
jgi:hypothetical protein